MVRKLYRNLALMLGVLALCLTSFTLQSTQQVEAQTAGCIQFGAPLLTHGIGAAANDQFLVGSNQSFTVVSTSSGAAKFAVNNTTFGGNPGIPGTSLEGLSASTPNTTVRALSCQNNFWDINLYVATKGATEGDMVTLFVQNADGSRTTQLAMFTIEGGKLVIKQFNSVSVHLNDRNANGFSTMQLNFNNNAPFSIAAGDAGNRTQLLTVAFQMLAGQQTNECTFFGFDIKRAGGTGTTSVVINDVVDIRQGTTAQGTGVFLGIAGQYPTQPKCATACPACPPSSGGGGGPTPTPTPTPAPVKCHTICFVSPDAWKLRLDCLTPGAYLCGFNVLVGGHNFNYPVNVCRADDVVAYALRGGRFFPTPFTSLSPLQQLNQQFVAAQLSIQYNANGPAFFDALWGNMSCYGNLQTLSSPVTLSTGYVLNSNSMLKELYQESINAIKNATTNPMNAGFQSDLVKLAAIWRELNGTSPYFVC